MSAWAWGGAIITVLLGLALLTLTACLFVSALSRKHDPVERIYQWVMRR